MTKHTPAPWKVSGEVRYAGFKIVDRNNRSIAAFPSTMTRPGEERTANAALIAMAPQLLAALEAIAKIMDHSPKAVDAIGFQNWIETNKLITKAKGN